MFRNYFCFFAVTLAELEVLKVSETKITRTPSKIPVFTSTKITDVSTSVDLCSFNDWEVVWGLLSSGGERTGEIFTGYFIGITITSR